MLSSVAVAKETASQMKNAGVPGQQGHSVRSITPIFSQLVAFSLPRGFVPVFEDIKGGQYIQESVIEGESIKKWSQMITLTGAKGLALNPNATPMKFANAVAGGFKRLCPNSYGAAGLGETRLGSHTAYTAIISCGEAGTISGQHSETMLLIVIKGQNDYYTIQWAERGKASKTPIRPDAAKWTERFRKLMPIKLCPIVPGEQAPYPSCGNS